MLEANERGKKKIPGWCEMFSVREELVTLQHMALDTEENIRQCMLKDLR